MKVVVAIDSFKGSMTSMQAGIPVKKAYWRQCRKQMWWSDHLQMVAREL